MLDLTASGRGRVRAEDQCTIMVVVNVLMLTVSWEKWKT